MAGQGDHEKPEKRLQAASVQAQQPRGLEEAAKLPEKLRQVSRALIARLSPFMPHVMVNQCILLRGRSGRIEIYGMSGTPAHDTRWQRTAHS